MRNRILGDETAGSHPSACLDLSACYRGSPIGIRRAALSFSEQPSGQLGVSAPWVQAQQSVILGSNAI